jgi:hypothetical protein
MVVSYGSRDEETPTYIKDNFAYPALRLCGGWLDSCIRGFGGDPISMLTFARSHSVKTAQSDMVFWKHLPKVIVNLSRRSLLFANSISFRLHALTYGHSDTDVDRKMLLATMTAFPIRMILTQSANDARATRVIRARPAAPPWW